MKRMKILCIISLSFCLSLLAACLPIMNQTFTTEQTLAGQQVPSAKHADALTFTANIIISKNAENPTVNNTVSAISLEFSEPLDPGTIAGAVKLFQLDQNGNQIEKSCITKINPNNPAILNIYNNPIEKFPDGEAYRIVISTKIKSAKGLAQAEEFTGYFATNCTFNLTDSASSKSTRSQIVVISDLHLGIDAELAEIQVNKQSLIDFLTQIKNAPSVKELVIAGDLLEEWYLPMDFKMPATQPKFVDAIAAANKSVLNVIKAIIKAGKIQVTYMPGDHDLLVTEANIERILPGINQARTGEPGLGKYVTGSDSEIVIEHGHRYDFFCAPDPISNRDIPENNSSILPPGYFMSRIAASSDFQRHPATSNVLPTISADVKDTSQYQYFLYFKAWQNLIEQFPVNDPLADKVIKTNIDGYTLDYSINDFLPWQDQATGRIDVNMYKGIQDTWGKRQALNRVKVALPCSEAIAGAKNSSYIDGQAKTQYFYADEDSRIVVFGHTHVACVLPMTNIKGKKTIYANSGTWIDKANGNPTRTFVVITPPDSGSAIMLVNLYQYAANKTATQWAEAQAIIIGGS